MRTIKFRALKDDMSDFRFVYGNLIYDHKDNPRIQEDRNEPTFTTCIKGTERQFTGLHDKNGKEIYEGDIIKGETRNFTVKFEEGMFTTDVGKYILNGDYEVIGNIHENPELLETNSSKNKA